MNKTLIFGNVCAPLIVSTPVYAQKSLVVPYLAQAKKLLPTIRIELEPGDGGEVASAGKLDFANFLPLHVKLALAQKHLAISERSRPRNERQRRERSFWRSTKIARKIRTRKAPTSTRRSRASTPIY